MVKRVGRPTNVPFSQKMESLRYSTGVRATVSNRRFDKYMVEMGEHVRNLDEGKLSLNEYGAARRDTMNAYQTGKPPYAFKPRKGDE